MGEDGLYAQFEWQPGTWYTIRDDCPYLDILISGNLAQAVEKGKLQKLDDAAPEGSTWQRWDFETEMSLHRRFGEISLPLKVPENTVLRCYIIPTALLRYPDVIAMIEDIESELGVDATWSVIEQRPDRSWSRKGNNGDRIAAPELVKQVQDELRFAYSIRRSPFSELGPRSRRNIPLPENALVSHWAAKRLALLRRSREAIVHERALLEDQAKRHNPENRQKRLLASIERLNVLLREITDLNEILSRLFNESELQTAISPSPAFLRDYRLRHLLRAFAPRLSEALSSIESARSHYPPIYLNRLWELWGAVWLAKEFRRWGFGGSCILKSGDELHSCSWRLQRGGVVLELDYEAHPTFIDYANVPPVHDRRMPILEWAAQHQEFDPEKPYFGAEEKSSPDYLVRITTPAGRFLIVGDACLASAEHHALKKPQDAKPLTVEDYRNTIGWVVEDQVVRCHPLGGFVLFPPPSASWTRLEQIQGARDCTLLCPSPVGDEATAERLASLLAAISPDIRASQV